jgi:hypothetical protein
MFDKLDIKIIINAKAVKNYNSHISKKQREGGKTWQRKDTRSNRNALNADVA